jgi:hypothetical protein
MSRSQVMHKNLFLKIFFSGYICFFFGVALPAHHHSDGVDHDDCVFCTMQKHASVTESVFSLPVSTGLPVESFTPPLQCFIPIETSSFHSRAPPVF